MPEGPSIVILKEKISYFKNKVVAEASGSAELDMETIAHRIHFGPDVPVISLIGYKSAICINSKTI